MQLDLFAKHISGNKAPPPKLAKTFLNLPSRTRLFIISKDLGLLREIQLEQWKYTSFSGMGIWNIVFQYTFVLILCLTWQIPVGMVWNSSALIYQVICDSSRTPCPSQIDQDFQMFSTATSQLPESILKLRYQVIYSFRRLRDSVTFPAFSVVLITQFHAVISTHHSGVRNG